MRQIDCGYGCFALVDEDDFGRLSQLIWRARLHNADRGPKAHRRPVRNATVNGKRVSIYLYHELLPKLDGFVVDHINGNVWDNRRSNLRYATRGQNVRNQEGHRNRVRPYKGICKKRQRWFASITVEGRTFWTSGFVAPEDAARAYDELALKHHGEFARLNFPETDINFAPLPVGATEPPSNAPDGGSPILLLGG